MLIHHVPGTLAAPDFINLIQACETYIDKYGMNATNEQGYDHPRFRSVMIGIFGEQAFGLIAQLKEHRK